MHKWVRQTRCPGNADRETVRSVPVAQVARVQPGEGTGDQALAGGLRAWCLPRSAALRSQDGALGPEHVQGLGSRSTSLSCGSCSGRLGGHPSRPLQGQGWGVL